MSYISIKKVISLASLPEDEIGLIMGYLNQKHKLSLVLVDKQIYHKAIKYLYQSIYVNFHDPVLINTDRCYPNNCKYTIINEIKQFTKLFDQRIDLLKHVKLVVFSRGTLTPSIQCNWIEFRSEILTLSKVEDIELANDISFPRDIINLTKDNYTIKSLNLFLSHTWINEFDFTTFSHFKAICKVRLFEIDSELFKLLTSKMKQPFNITRLTLTFDSFDHEIEGITKLFNLDDIVNLELTIRNYEGDTHTYGQMTWLFKNLPNLKHLSLSSYVDQIEELLELVEPNSLTNLIMGVYGLCPCSLSNKIRSQQYSLERISLAWNFSYTFPVIEDFDWICKPGQSDFSERSDYQNMIKEFLQDDINAFPPLSHIIISKCHYEITRNSSEFQVIPTNY